MSPVARLCFHPLGSCFLEQCILIFGSGTNRKTSFLPSIPSVVSFLGALGFLMLLHMLSARAPCDIMVLFPWDSSVSSNGQAKA